MQKIDELLLAMMDYEAQTPDRIQHFVKVHEFTRLLGFLEGLDAHTRLVSRAAAVVHDIGIRPALQKYGSCDGPYQEQEGPAPARDLLTRLGWETADIDRVCYLVGHHHTYTGVEGADYQILIEADFLVNLYEGGASQDAIDNAYQHIFKTKSGKMLFEKMFPVQKPEV